MTITIGMKMVITMILVQSILMHIIAAYSPITSLMDIKLEYVTIIQTVKCLMSLSRIVGLMI